MKKMTKTFLGTLVLVFALALLISGSVFAKGSKGSWYSKLRKSKKKEYGYYRGLDIDRDGKYELFLSNQKKGNLDYEGQIEIWTRYKNKNVRLITFNGGGGCKIFQYNLKMVSISRRPDPGDILCKKPFRLILL